MHYPRSYFPTFIVVGILLWGMSAAVIWAAIPDWATRGQFGDMFGAINALFSGLALAGAVYAVLVQHRQLTAQERELALNAKLNAISALIAAYTERARYCDSRAAPNMKEVNSCQERIKELAAHLENLLQEDSITRQPTGTA